MTSPIDAVRAIHNVFRKDIAMIDAAALDAARGKSGLEKTVERFRFFNEVLEWHAHGEELAMFPALEAVAPSVAEAYETDHRALDAAFEALSNAVSVRDPLETARATKAFKYFLDVHLDKEDGHLYRLIGERVSVPDQGQASASWPAPSRGSLPGAGGVDVPLDGPRRPREHDPHLAEGDAARIVHRRHTACRACDPRWLARADAAHSRAGGAFEPSSAPQPEPIVRVGDDFEDEYPGASALATECYANLWRAAELLIGLHDRHTADRYQLSPSARGVLAVVEGAGQPLEPTVIAERLIVTTGSMTSLLDNLEKRGLVRRLPHPDDRRKILIDITPDARAIIDELLPAMHARERDVVDAALTASEQRTLLRSLAKLQQAAAEARSEAAPQRRRPPSPTDPETDPPDPRGSQR